MATTIRLVLLPSTAFSSQVAFIKNNLSYWRNIESYLRLPPPWVLSASAASLAVMNLINPWPLRTLLIGKGLTKMTQNYKIPLIHSRAKELVILTIMDYRDHRQKWRKKHGWYIPMIQYNTICWISIIDNKRKTRKPETCFGNGLIYNEWSVIK